jgi:hypothetical protein
MDLFDKIRKSEHGHLLEVAGMCAGAMALILAAVFISQGGMAKVSHFLAINTIAPGSLTADVFPCGWFGDCTDTISGTYALTANTTSITYGQPVTLALANYGVQQPAGYYTEGCKAPTGVPEYDMYYNCTLTGVGQVYGPSCDGGIYTYTHLTQGCHFWYLTVYPTQTTTYTFSATAYNGSIPGYPNLGSRSVTITVAPRPTTLSSFVATPAALPNLNSGTTLSWSGTAGTYFGGCTLSGGQWPGGGTAVAMNSSKPTNTLAVPTTYTLNCTDTGFGPVSRTVTVPVGAVVNADITGPASVPVSQAGGATLSFYADSVTPPTGCMIKSYNDATILYTGAACPSSANATWPTGAYSNPGSYAYRLWYNQNGWVYSGKTATVSVPPSCTLTASSNTVTPGSTVTLTYTASGGTNASLNNNAGPVALVAGTPVKWVSGPCANPPSGPPSCVFSLPVNAKITRIDAVGGGGAGTLGYGGGGGGGAYEQALNPANFPSNTNFTYYVGAAGVANSGAGGYTGILNSTGNWAVLAYGGGGGVYGGSGVGVGGGGGSPYSIAGVTGYYGGTGGNGAYGGGGGGGAAGPSGKGGNGGSYAGGNYSGGGGGGGADGGSNGTNNDYPSPPNQGGYGGYDGYSGGGGGVSYPYYPNCSGGNVNGGGGAGGTAAACGGSNGSSDLAFGSYGVGGGGGGGGSGAVGVNGGGRPGGAGGNYGGGGGAGGAGSYGGNGGAGLLVITYTPYTLAPSASTTTLPVTTTPTVFTMTVTDSISGLSNTCSAPVAITDVCSDISGFQPTGWTAPGCQAGPVCIPASSVYNGSACVPAAVTVAGFSGPARVRKGSTVTLTYALTNPGGMCRVTGSSAYDSGPFPAAASGSVTSSPIMTNTIFTLICGEASRTITVGIIPGFQEI